MNSLTFQRREILMINSVQSFVHDPCTSISNEETFFSKLSTNSEANASRISIYVLHSDCYIRCERVKHFVEVDWGVCSTPVKAKLCNINDMESEIF